MEPESREGAPIKSLFDDFVKRQKPKKAKSKRVAPVAPESVTVINTTRSGRVEAEQEKARLTREHREAELQLQHENSIRRRTSLYTPLVVEDEPHEDTPEGAARIKQSARAEAGKLAKATLPVLKRLAEGGRGDDDIPVPDSTKLAAIGLLWKHGVGEQMDVTIANPQVLRAVVIAAAKRMSEADREGFKLELQDILKQFG